MANDILRDEANSGQLKLHHGLNFTTSQSALFALRTDVGVIGMQFRVIFEHFVMAVLPQVRSSMRATLWDVL